MISEKKAGRLIGALILIDMVSGVLINQVLLGPFTFAVDFMNKVAENSNQVILGMLLGLISGATSIASASLLLPIFKKYHEVLAYMLLGSSVVCFACILGDNSNVQSLLTLSQEYLKAGSIDSEYFRTMGKVFHDARRWTHFMTILVPCFYFITFFCLLYLSKLIPRFISIWGLLGIIGMATAILLAIFEKGSNMLLYLPFGLNQLFLAIWLLARGFSSTANNAVGNQK